MNRNYWVVILLIAFTAIASFACGTPKDAKTTDGDADTPVVTGDTPDPMDELMANARKGFDLFKDPALSGSENENACMTCHPYGGAGESVMGHMPTGSMIGVAEEFPKPVMMVAEQLGEDPITLVQMINFCITNPLAGTALAEDDPTMLALLDFHKVLIPQTYEANALPIIQKNCSPCHVGADAKQGDLTEKGKALSEAEEIREYVESGRMPMGGTLSDKDYLSLIIWATHELEQMM